MKVPLAFKYIVGILTILVLGCKGPTVVETPEIKIPAHPLHNEDDLDALIDQIGDRKIVLLGEASHGTAEYYSWRAAISKRLIQEKGFRMIAIEGEWTNDSKLSWSRTGVYCGFRILYREGDGSRFLAFSTVLLPRAGIMYPPSFPNGMMLSCLLMKPLH